MPASLLLSVSPDPLPSLQPSLQDYYGITFPGPTAALSGRDGSLANNPYSGEALADVFGRHPPLDHG